MSRYEVIDIANYISWNGAVPRKQSLVSLLSLRVACQQEHFILVCDTLEVSIVPLEHFKDSAS